ncbi:MAG: ATP-binding cassette domain-containing protein [Muribaculum sp.]|nr:ATP-binding cassette domain-containing protein [Muribaculum sp.]
MSSKSCGATCLRIILKMYNKDVPEWELIEKFPLEQTGWSINTLLSACNHYNLHADIIDQCFSDIKQVSLPIILLACNHYVVIYRIKGKNIYVADPRIGKIKYTITEFKNLIGEDYIAIQIQGVTSEGKSNESSPVKLFANFYGYYQPYKKYILNILIVMGIVAIAQLLIPFASRAIIDIGIEGSSWNYIRLIILGILLMNITIIVGEYIQIYLITHISNRVKILMLEEYFIKFLSIPYLYLLGINKGDLIQRITDNERIQNYIITTLIQTIVSTLLLAVYLIALFIFSAKLATVFLFISAVYIIWNCIFLHCRKRLDFNFWKIKSENNKYLIEAYDNFVDIRNYGLFNTVVNKWRSNLFELFDQNSKFLKFSQLQELGSKIIIQLIILILTFLSCNYVIDGTFSLGTLFAVQYIIGNIYIPLSRIPDFMSQTQLTLISLQRINAFNQTKSEFTKSGIILPKHRDIVMQSLLYKYPNGKVALSNISLNMKSGMKYGITGESGCGKSTILKIICGILTPSSGKYMIGTTNSSSIGHDNLIKFISVYLQDSSIFHGTILENIVCDNANIDEDRLIKVVEIASIRREIEQLNNSYNSIIGDGSNMLSKGQQQRILLARTLYKEADIYLFDEVTNCLDESMGKRIISKIDLFLKDKTRVYVTHQKEILNDANLIYFIHQGYILKNGSYEDFYGKEEQIHS